MESVELYRQLLGLGAPWTVERVELDVAKGHVEVYVGHASGQRFACPECEQELAVYDHLDERVWRHLDSMQFLTYLHGAAGVVLRAWGQASASAVGGTGGPLYASVRSAGDHGTESHQREAGGADSAH